MFMENKKNNIYYLHELPDYKIADGYPDIRNWKVYDNEELCIGKVDKLIVNKNMQQVAYLNVEADSSILDLAKLLSNSDDSEIINKDSDRHLIIPIGLVRLDKDSNKVYTKDIDHSTFATSILNGKNEVIERSHELKILENFKKSHETYPEGDELYERGEFKRFEY